MSGVPIPVNATLTRDSPFSYQCRACSRCCHGYRIRVNPFEAVTLARFIGVSTTQFIARFLAPDSKLLHKPGEDSCVFLGERGCTVHPARPLACRLYPLGRFATTGGEERFYPLAPHPQTDGIYGSAGTVGEYVTGQGADAFIAAADRYLELYCRCVAALGGDPEAGTDDLPVDSDLLDADRVIERYSPGRGREGLAPVDAMNLHIEALEALLLQNEKEPS